MPIVTCAYEKCDKSYHVYPSDVKRGFRKHCSQSCATKAYWASEAGTQEKLRKAELRIEKPKKGILRRYVVQGYISLSGMWEHPLASPQVGTLLEHRLVLWNKLKCISLYCEHSCHWCGKMITWSGMSGIVADHLDDNGLNNDPNNLVPSCAYCNSQR